MAMGNEVKRELIRVLIAALLGGLVAFLSRLVEGLGTISPSVWQDVVTSGATASAYVMRTLA